MQTAKRWSLKRILVSAALVLAMVLMPNYHVEASTDTVVKTVSVRLHANGGSYKEGGYGVVDQDNCTVEFKINSDGAVSFVNVDMRPEWKGKALLGWSTDKNAKWETWSEWFEQYDEEVGRYKFALPLDGSITDLYAVWTDEYAITLDANGGNFGTNTDKYGKTTDIETFNITIHKTKDGSMYSYVPTVLIDQSGMEHIGWSADKNAKFPEYESPGSLPLDKKPPEVLYAVFGDPKAGSIKVNPRKTKYNVDLSGNRGGTIAYTIKWFGVVKPREYSCNVTFEEGNVKILSYKNDFDWEYKLSGDAYVASGKITYKAKSKGVVKLKISAGINGKKKQATVTINVTDSSKQTQAVSPKAKKAVVKGKTYTVNKLKYKVTNADMKGKGTVTLIGTTLKKTKLTNLTVPKTAKIYGATFKVTAIGKMAFRKFTKIKTIAVGDNVRTIGASAFAGDTALKKVQIGKGVTGIGKAAFFGDKKLKTITIKTSGLKSVGKNAIKKIHKKAVIKVPKKQLKKYKKLFSSKTGFKKSMKVKK